MTKFSDYFYKGYDISNKNRMEKLVMEYQNPYGYNFESCEKRVVDYEKNIIKPNQDFVKNKEYLGKR